MMAEQEETEKAYKPARSLVMLFYFQLLTSITILAVVFIGGYYLCDSIPVPSPMTLEYRYAYGLRCSIPMAFFLLLTIWQTANRRGSTAAGNPLSGNEHLVQVLKNISTNTHEQAMIGVMLIMIAVTYCDTPETIKIAPLYSLSFTIGRILFIIGYRIHPKYRSCGMLISLFGSSAIAGYMLYLVFTKGFMYGLGTAYAPAGCGGGGISGKEEL